MLKLYYLWWLLACSADALSSQLSCIYQTRRQTRESYSISSSRPSSQNHNHRSGIFSPVLYRGRRCTLCHLSTRPDGNAGRNSHGISEPTHSAVYTSSAHTSSPDISRRAALIQSLTLLILSLGISESSSASEIDTAGQLFTPKNEMIKGGGSTSARGIRLKPKEDKASKNRKNESLLNKSGLIQNVYETRFITYLARFLLVFDPSASSWWKKNSKANGTTDSDDDADVTATSDVTKERFAEFAESVEIGLADYFLGPYGSYASVAAAKAGLAAAEPAKSVREPQDNDSLLNVIFGRKEKDRRHKKQTQSKYATSKRKSTDTQQDGTSLARQGVLNLFSLLKARYTSIEEKQQLAILFSLISTTELQPVDQIRGLLGEIDNGTIAEVELFDLFTDDNEDSLNMDGECFRLSSRLGGGFSKLDEEIIRVDPPAPLGDDYKPAKIRAVMEPTSRILRIDVIDGGQGYTIAPDVIIKQSGVSRQCEACAILDRKGSVSEVVVLFPGFGYGCHNKRNELDEPILPIVEFKEQKGHPERIAVAVPQLEYKVVGVEIIDGGSGYLFDEPPRVSLDMPSSDPEWFATPVILIESEEDEEKQLILASVTQMKNGTSGVTVDTSSVRRERDAGTKLSDDTLRSIKMNPIALLPSDTRPQFSKFISSSSSDVIENGFYSVTCLPPVQSKEALPSSKYRSTDALFGGIGRAPVMKNALTLSSSQYIRLALSGAICTVVVRTALNPLELVKTKIQLRNDEEIIEFAMNKALLGQDDPHATSVNKPIVVGTAQVIQSLIEVRGPLSLFQSADITLLTSVVFGLFGFGATELFRRSFSAVFFDEAAEGPSEILLLAAAGLATSLTCAAGAPFEILRVRSMCTLKSQNVKQVFEEFVEQNRIKRTNGIANNLALSTGIQIEDIKPLWSSFLPIISRELPFALTKFLVFDLASRTIADLINGSSLLGDEEIKVGVGGTGLVISAFSGGLAGIAGAFVSHPADLVLTVTSASSPEQGKSRDWKVIVKELIAADGGVFNLFSAFPARALFFFFVIGLQFFLYDYIKTLLDVGEDDLQLILDVFYAVRQGLS